MRYQNEKDGEWHILKDCKLISESRPRVIVCDNFITKDQCEELIELGTPHLQRSGVVANSNKNHEIRSSYGTRLPTTNPLVRMIDRRLLSLTGMKGNLAERLYLLRYEKGQLYREHGDAFAGIHGQIFLIARKKRYQAWLKKLENKRRLKKQKEKDKKKSNNDNNDDDDDDSNSEETIEQLAIRLGGEENPAKGIFANISDGKEYTMTDRAVTTLLYLRGDIVGGNTSFPLLKTDATPFRAGEAKELKQRRKALKKQQQKLKKQEMMEKNHDDNATKDENDESHLAVEASCDPNDHFTVAPAVGRLLIFYDLKEDGGLDPRASHAGCAVLGDKPKFTITKWMQIGLP